MPLLERGGAPLRPLLDELQRADQALFDSMHTAVDVMRGEAAYRPSALAAAQGVVEDCLRDLSADAVAIPDLSDEEKRRLLVQLDWRRRLVSRQLAIEDWFASWQKAEESRP